MFSGLNNLKFLYLQENQIWELPADTFSSCHLLTAVDISFNQIRRLEKYTFRYNINVDDLLLNNNLISYIDYEAFPANMTDLKLLNLSNNIELRSWQLPPGGFPNLRVIALEQMFFLHQVPNPNEIPQIQEMYYTYAYLCCIWYNNMVETLEQPAPMGLNVTEPPAVIPTDPVVTLPPHINVIGREDPFLLDCQKRGEISDERIEHLLQFQATFNATVTVLPNCAIEINIHGQASVDAVGTSENKFIENASVRFENLNRELPPGQPELKCFPQPNPLTPCENLMDPWVLRIAIWVIWVLVVLGYVTVIFIMIAAREKVDAPQIFIFCLTSANFCIGVYLAFLAVVDVQTYGEQRFYQSALDWQLGPGCKTAGFIAVFASVLSVYSLVALTLERVHTIAYTFNTNHRVRRRVAIFVVIFGVFFSAGIATMPLFGVNSYSKVAVCLPFVTEQLKDKIYIGLIFSINLIGFFVMLVSCIYIFCRIRKLPEADRKRQEFSMTCMITLLIVATFISWVPLAVIGYSALADMPLVTAGQAKFFLVFVYPVNASVSPFIYAIFIRQFRQRMKSNAMVKNTKKVHSSPPAHPLHIKESQSTTVHSDQLPFQLGPLYSLSSNSSLPNLQEVTEDSEDLDTTAAAAVREVRVALNGSQASNESMMKHLSVVLEGDEESCPANDQSASESDSDAHKSLQAHRPTDVGRRVERSTDLDATTTAAAVADSYRGGALCHHSPSPSPNSSCPHLTGRQATS